MSQRKIKPAGRSSRHDLENELADVTTELAKAEGDLEAVGELALDIVGIVYEAPEPWPDEPPGPEATIPPWIRRAIEQGIENSGPLDKMHDVVQSILAELSQKAPATRPSQAVDPAEAETSKRTVPETSA